MAYEPKKFTPAELAELHQLPNEALLTAQEAAAFLRLKYNTLSWYRCNSGGPAFVRVGPKLIRYRMGDLREYMKGQPMGEGQTKHGMTKRFVRPPVGLTTWPEECSDTSLTVPTTRLRVQ